ncbi:MAG: hypothetical protein JW795_04735 [Chitinivibrionales bacterium]|nr:hypothetical protein [Chitinivibrionales bacterium]
MVLKICLTALPILFLIVLFGGGALMKRRKIDMDGVAPIDRGLFYLSKYSALALWMIMVLQIWGVHFTLRADVALARYASYCSWVLGFSLLFCGRLLLGDSFRIGSPLEGTRLKVSWLFRLSRNPMYCGLYATAIAAFLNTLNPIIFVAMIFVIAVHHRIILGEERYLRGMFGDEYARYCDQVRRYL